MNGNDALLLDPTGPFALFALPEERGTRAYRPPDAEIAAHQRLVARRKRARRSAVAELRRRKSKR